MIDLRHEKVNSSRIWGFVSIATNRLRRIWEQIGYGGNYGNSLNFLPNAKINQTDKTLF